jgi:hypothetical protein
MPGMINRRARTEREISTGLRQEAPRPAARPLPRGGSGTGPAEPALSRSCCGGLRSAARALPADRSGVGVQQHGEWLRAPAGPHGQLKLCVSVANGDKGQEGQGGS